MQLGKECRKHPDWFREKASILKPLFEKRNKLYAKFLCTRKEDDRRAFAAFRTKVRKDIRDAKNDWFQNKVMEAQSGRFGGKIVWRCIRDIQRGRRGLVPRRSVTVRNEDGTPCNTPQEEQQRWNRHFSKLLNVQSQFDKYELDKVEQRPLRSEMDDLPTREELEKAVGKLKNGKAGGNSKILPEMVKVAWHDDEFADVLMELVHDVWRQQRVSKDWVDAVLIPIPKKGNLTNCDNWRGIALLDVVGKVVTRVLQERLQALAEEVLPESQCGFRKGRSCTDMIFTVHQIIEKSQEHRSKAFITCIDLKKACDSVPRKALWLALGKLGVPERTVSLIRSFHENMQARVQLDGSLSDVLDVENGLRQGCCMAPVLFNLYTCLAIERWSERTKNIEGIGIKLRYKYDKKLFRRYTRNAEESTLSSCLFADDGALLATTRCGATTSAQEYQSTATKFRLTVSIPKTKHMATGREITDLDNEEIPVHGGEIETVEDFPYLGSMISATGRMDCDVERRIAQASKAFGALRKPVFLDHDLTNSTKRKLYEACVMSVLNYGSECWIPLKRHQRKLNSFHHRCIRNILQITNRQQWAQHITNQEIRSRWGDPDTASDKIKKRRLERLGHLARMPAHRIPKMALFGWLPQPRPRCGPKRRWRDVFRKDIRDLNLDEDKWYDAASTHRSRWRSLYREGWEHYRDVCHKASNPVDQARRDVHCRMCNRSFRRECDMKRHKCIEERSKPISEQRGAVMWHRWFRSRGGLAVHVCRPTTNQC